jgi:hypothetical protein
MTWRTDWASYIMQRAPAYGIDPRAAVIVAMGEGLSGRVGDGGHAFGPFQLNNAGGVLTKMYPGQNNPKAIEFAGSQRGIDWALQQMARYARGKTGPEALRSIIYDFERPADKAGSYANALARWRQKAWTQFSKDVPFKAPNTSAQSTGDFSAAPAMSGQGAPSLGRALLAKAMENNNAFLATGTVPTGDWASTFSQAKRAATQFTGLPSTAMGPGPDPIMFNGKVQYPNLPRFVGEGGTAEDLANLRLALAKAQSLGLRIGENTLFDQVDPVHTNTSNHYQLFPGTKINRAADISGDSAKMAAFYRWAMSRFPGVRELFYDPLGGIKAGKQIGAIGGHGKHVHIAF